MICWVNECGRPGMRPHGLCKKHAVNAVRFGNPVAVKDRPLGDRIALIGWDITEKGCWEWRGNRGHFGHATLSSKKYGLVNARVHRIMYEVFVGLIPEGLFVLHNCDNPPCINPQHLRIGTHADNMRDRAERGHTGGYRAPDYRRRVSA